MIRWRILQETQPKGQQTTKAGFSPLVTFIKQRRILKVQLVGYLYLPSETSAEASVFREHSGSRQLGNIQSTLGNIQSTLGNIRPTSGNIQSTLGNIQSTIGNIQSSLGNMQSSLGNIQSTLRNIQPSLGNTQYLFQMEIIYLHKQGLLLAFFLRRSFASPQLQGTFSQLQGTFSQLQGTYSQLQGTFSGRRQ